VGPILHLNASPSLAVMTNSWFRLAKVFFYNFYLLMEKSAPIQVPMNCNLVQFLYKSFFFQPSLVSISLVLLEGKIEI
jgi:hypothetical protein